MCLVHNCRKEPISSQLFEDGRNQREIEPSGIYVPKKQTKEQSVPKIEWEPYHGNKERGRAEEKKIDGKEKPHFLLLILRQNVWSTNFTYGILFNTYK